MCGSNIRWRGDLAGRAGRERSRLLAPRSAGGPPGWLRGWSAHGHGERRVLVHVGHDAAEGYLGERRGRRDACVSGGAGGDAKELVLQSTDESSATDTCSATHIKVLGVLEIAHAAAPVEFVKTLSQLRLALELGLPGALVQPALLLGLLLPMLQAGGQLLRKQVARAPAHKLGQIQLAESNFAAEGQVAARESLGMRGSVHFSGTSIASGATAYPRRA